MTVEAVVDMIRDGLYLIIRVSMPLLLVSLVVGLVVSIFQTMTSIQEQTLTFVPKVISIFVALALLGDWIMTAIVEYTTQLWSSFSMYVHR